ncbi:MAG: hypothetical protein PVF74_12225 [Anaerolineales bacterium]|jgi:hypothetical protein
MDTTNFRLARNVLIKALLLFIIINLLFAATAPLSILGKISIYNLLVPGRLRLPYGDDPTLAYNLSTYNLVAMLASHELSAGSKAADEYRVILLGDSSTWGFLLEPEQTLSAQINAAGYTLDDGRRVRAYNLGYPVMSLTKDLLILSLVKRYQPDLIVWPLTLESFPYDKQLFPPLLQNNPEAVQELTQKHDLDLKTYQADPTSQVAFNIESFWGSTILGQRRSLAEIIRLQLYGVMWAATGIDQHIPETYTPRMEDLPDDLSFHDLEPSHLNRDDLAFDVVQAGIDLAGDTPIILVNEPMFISQGENSDVRYNFYYPRWAYDDFRVLMNQESQKKGWSYIDLWDAIASTEFTNSAVHLSPAGTAQFAKLLEAVILEAANSAP